MLQQALYASIDRLRSHTSIIQGIKSSSPNPKLATIAEDTNSTDHTNMFNTLNKIDIIVCEERHGSSLAHLFIGYNSPCNLKTLELSSIADHTNQGAILNINSMSCPGLLLRRNSPIDASILTGIVRNLKGRVDSQ